jgi:hypothetical protein
MMKAPKQIQVKSIKPYIDSFIVTFCRTEFVKETPNGMRRGALRWGRRTAKPSNQKNDKA